MNKNKKNLSPVIEESRPLWRNALARSAVNRKVGGLSPPRGESFISHPKS